MFLDWGNVASISHRRSGNNQIYTVTAADGSTATFTSYTFFRPKKVARLIAARAGLSIEKAQPAR
jgi:hypothetical protein